jgi:hypothetical protein
MSKRNIRAEIQDIKARTTCVDMDNGIAKLLSLCVQVKQLEKESEQHGYFIVASIAGVEAYFRWQIQDLIDSGNPKYVNNLRLDKLPVKIDHDLALALSGKQITVGELVAHTVSLSSFEAISSTMRDLLDVDFVKLLKDAREPEFWNESDDAATVILKSPENVISCVKEAFRLRHIICHEAHLRLVGDLADIKEICSSCYSLVLASYYGIAFYRASDAPLSLEESCRIACEKFSSLKSEVESFEKMISGGLSCLGKSAFDSMQNAWRAYVELEAGFFSSVQYNGNRGEYEAMLTRLKLYSRRIEEFQKWS